MNSLSIEDDDIFLQPTSSTLHGLFGPMSIDKSENNDLTYAAPKQPKSVQKQKLTTAPVKTTVVFAKVVQVYKSIDDSYKIIGKYGLALISDTVKLAEILIYKDKLNILTRITLNNTKIYLENNYVSFNDSNNEKWYVQFDDDTYLKEFLEELRKGNVNFIEVVKEKAKDNTTDVTSEKSNSKANDNESETSNISQTRADILTRMAKMGQSILPGNLKNESNDVKDAYPSSPKSIELNVAKACDNQNEINYTSNENKRNNNISDKGAECPLIMNNSLTPVFPYIQAYPKNTTLLNNMIPSQEFNMLVSENRIQNSEVRMNLTALSSKLDTVLNEIAKIKEPPNTDKLENEFLKSKVIDLEKQLNNLSGKLGEMNQNTATLESLIRNKNEEIEKEKRNVFELQNTLRNMENQESKLNNFERKEKELNTLIIDLQSQLEISKGSIKENDVKCAKLQEINETLLKDNENLNVELKSMATKSQIAEKKSEEKLELEVKCLSNIIKESMNLMYQNIMSQYEKPDEQLLQSQFKAILSTNIKQATFNVIEKFRTFLKTTDNSFTSADSKRSA